MATAQGRRDEGSGLVDSKILAHLLVFGFPESTARFVLPALIFPAASGVCTSVAT